ncbi:ABC transporter substrate-binding protein [Caulobacter sp. S45]|uniref:ABC transporter substrate-binding protein n=1 Tax=Caulobacter sp. S45 TaxID=1641861 RepID=UPI0015759F19|nr:ABC transporter substrate-binding protein [Caulobacter sp. S45]
MRCGGLDGLKLIVLASLVGALGCSIPRAVARPVRVMSINGCSDQLVLALADPRTIASVTWLSRDPEGSYMWRAAQHVPVNHGSAEEVVRDHPDLVIAGSYTTPATRALLVKLHYRLLVLQPADSFDDIRRETRTVASALGATERGRALIAHMDATLTRLAADKGPPLRVAAWDGAGFSAAPGSLYASILKVAGARNVTAQTQGMGGSTPEVEKLIATAPQLLVAGAPGFEKPGRQTDVAHHPLVRRFWSDRTLVVPLSSYECGTPFSADAALSLREQMRAKLARAQTPLPFAPVSTP